MSPSVSESSNRALGVIDRVSRHPAVVIFGTLVLAAVLPFPLALVSTDGPNGVAEARLGLAARKISEASADAPRSDRHVVPAGDSPASPLDPRSDPARIALRRARDRCFSSRSEIASGRFLDAFDEEAPVLDAIDLERIRIRRRTPRWVQLEVEHFPPRGDPNTARLRIINEDRKWKLERVELLPRPFAPREPGLPESFDTTR